MWRCYLRAGPGSQATHRAKTHITQMAKCPLLSCSECWTSVYFLFQAGDCCGSLCLVKRGVVVQGREKGKRDPRRSKEGKKQQSRHCFHFKTLWTEHLSLPAPSSNNSREIKYRDRERAPTGRAETLILVLAFSSGGYAAPPPERPGRPRCPHRRRWLVCAPRAGPPCIRARPRAARPAARTGRRAG